MKNDEKGFSLIELLAIIVITSVIIIPLMTTFVNFFEINNRMHDRRNAVGIADIATNSVGRFDFLDIYNELQTQKASGNLYMMLDHNGTNCNFTFTDPTVNTVCDIMFNLEFNNMTIPPGDMQIYFIDYNLNAADHDYFDPAINPTPTIPSQVLESINNIPEATTGEDVASIMRYIVYVKYSDDPVGVVVLDGVMIND